jgi:hypothetical protein
VALDKRQRVLFNLSPHQLRQLGDVRRDPADFVACQELRRGTSAGFILAMDISERLPIAVSDDEAISSTDQGGGKRRSAVKPLTRDSN